MISPYLGPDCGRYDSGQRRGNRCPLRRREVGNNRMPIGRPVLKGIVFLVERMIGARQVAYRRTSLVRTEREGGRGNAIVSIVRKVNRDNTHSPVY